MIGRNAISKRGTKMRLSHDQKEQALEVNE